NTIQAAAYDGVVGGGVANTIQGGASESVIAGGIQNTNGGYCSAIGGGRNNVLEASAWYGFLGGGVQNIIRSNSLGAFIGGGLNNSLQSSSNDPGSSWGAAIVGGENNTIAPNGFSAPRDSVIAGGSYNSLVGAYNSTIGGGTGNSLQSSEYSLIAGGYYNSIQSNVFYSAIGGGQYNQIQSGGYDAIIAGGSLNTVAGQHAVIGGGSQNVNNSLYSTIGGGFSNLVQSASWYATIAGGQQNDSSAYYATVAGGIANQAAGGSSAIGGGWNNLANNSYSVVSGGFFNSSGGFASVIGGGFGNVSQGSYASVPGGYDNAAAGDYSLAAGYLAQANHNGAFVWSDTSSNSIFASTAPNQFNVRATGGVRFFTGGAGMILDGQSVATANALNNLNAGNITAGTLSDARLSPNVPLLNAGLNTFAGDLAMSGGAAYHKLSLSGGNAAGYLYGSYPGLGDGIHLGYNYYYDAAGGGHYSNAGGLTSRISVQYGQIDLAVGTTPGAAPTVDRLVANGAGVTVYGTFNNLSDRAAKRDFAPVSSSKILEEVARLPISEWSYKEDAATRHVGPVAQDFYSLFNIGTDDKHIAPIDEGGVALAAIQGLNEKVEGRSQKAEARIQRLEAENAGLKRQNQSLATRLDALERIIHDQKPN
ncbi:MAG TPA: tail fiber domain-containing protein, partial [Candidatus Acidoferrum sp.]|nr:tail fiber domain-containing protein [Candidatus Acidoferrum sp.]